MRFIARFGLYAQFKESVLKMEERFSGTLWAKAVSKLFNLLKE